MESTGSPVQIILVVDTVHLKDRLVTYEQREVVRFLRQNGGHLAHPLRIFALTRTGLWTLPPSMPRSKSGNSKTGSTSDGNALADEFVHSTTLDLARRTHSISGGESLEPLPEIDPPGLTALKALSKIVTSENRIPGRKLLIWVGPGWAVGSGMPFFSNLDREQLFAGVQFFSTLLRQARITLYTTSVGEIAPSSKSQLYLNTLSGLDSLEHADIADLDRRVLAVQSGGRVLPPSDDLTTNISDTGLTDRKPEFDLAGQIDSCVAEADAFYTLSFNPAVTERFDDYRDIHVLLRNPDLIARTRTGYYDEPYFYDAPHAARTRVSTDRLQQILHDESNKRDDDLARRLSSVELSETLAGDKLASVQASIHGEKSRLALLALADESAFQPTAPEPSPGLNSPPAPSPDEQQHIIAAAAEYLSKTMPKLPNFMASRTTLHFEETPEHYGPSSHRRLDYQPLHYTDTSKAGVLYRGGQEVVESASEKSKAHRNKYQTQDDRGMSTSGTFGPILLAVSDAMAAPGGLTWSHWEPDADGTRAVFQYSVPAGQSRYLVKYCCLPDRSGATALSTLSAYHGQVAIDSTSGAIRRLTLQADLKPGLPIKRSDILVVYAPVVIGAKTYLCPVKSVSISRSRTVMDLTEGDESFRVFGPFVTLLNDVTFDGYHIFRSEARVLTGFEPSTPDH